MIGQLINIKGGRQSERGNVLFLILIAVALFAALSYAVTSSTRSGGSGANEETNLISSAQITQYPSTIRTTIIRMVVSNNTAAEDLIFNEPEEFDEFDTAFPDDDESLGVFHPEGGNATYADAPGDIMAVGGGNQDGKWFFNAENEIVFVGRSASDASSEGTVNDQTADLIAFLPGLNEAICRRINEELSIEDTAAGGGVVIPVESGIDYDTTEMVTTAGTPVGICDGGTCGGGVIGVTGTNADSLNAQPFGCFRDGTTGPFVYYHVLVER